jgi:hypothetical protein
VRLTARTGDPLLWACVCENATGKVHSSVPMPSHWRFSGLAGGR